MTPTEQAAEALRRFVHVMDEEQIDDDLCIVFDPNRHHSSLRVRHLRALARLTAEQPPVATPATVEELDRILNSESDEEIEIWSDGSVHPKGHAEQPPTPPDRERLSDP